VVPAENQLPAGQPSAAEQRRIQPAASRAFEPRSELEYVELEERREREPLRQRRYLEEESDRGRGEPYGSEPPRPARRPSAYDERLDRDDRIERDDASYADEPRGYGAPRYGDREAAGYGREPEGYEPEARRSEAGSRRSEPEPLPYDDEPPRSTRDPLPQRRPSASSRTRDERPEPIDVEPEVIDDPW
jgi:hypothetical protein